MHEDDRVGDLPREAHLVRHHDHGHAAGRQILDHMQDLAGQLRVERRGHLVEQHDLGLHGERSGDGGALLLAAGHLLGIGVRLVLEPDPAQHREGEVARLPLGDLLHRPGRQGDVLGDRQMGKQIVALEDDADVEAQLPQIDLGIADPVIADDDLAAVDPLERSMQRNAVLLPEPLRPMMR